MPTIINPISGRTGQTPISYEPLTREKEYEQIYTEPGYSGGYSKVGGGIGGTTNPALSTPIDSGGSEGGAGVAHINPPHHGGHRKPVINVPEPAIVIEPVQPTPTQEELRKTTTIQEKVPGQELKYAVNVGGSLYTSEGYIYPGASSDFMPRGYQEGEKIVVGKDAEGNEQFIVSEKGSQFVSTKFGTAIRTPSGAYSLIKPDEKAIAKEQKAYADWAATQKSTQYPNILTDITKKTFTVGGVTFNKPTELAFTKYVTAPDVALKETVGRKPQLAVKAPEVSIYDTIGTPSRFAREKVEEITKYSTLGYIGLSRTIFGQPKEKEVVQAAGFYEVKSKPYQTRGTSMYDISIGKKGEFVSPSTTYEYFPERKSIIRTDFGKFTEPTISFGTSAIMFTPYAVASAGVGVSDIGEGFQRGNYQQIVRGETELIPLATLGILRFGGKTIKTISSIEAKTQTGLTKEELKRLASLDPGSAEFAELRLKGLRNLEKQYEKRYGMLDPVAARVEWERRYAALTATFPSAADPFVTGLKNIKILTDKKQLVPISIANVALGEEGTVAKSLLVPVSRGEERIRLTPASLDILGKKLTLQQYYSTTYPTFFRPTLDKYKTATTGQRKFVLKEIEGQLQSSLVSTKQTKVSARGIQFERQPIPIFAMTEEGQVIISEILPRTKGFGLGAKVTEFDVMGITEKGKRIRGLGVSSQVSPYTGRLTDRKVIARLGKEFFVFGSKLGRPVYNAFGRKSFVLEDIQRVRTLKTRSSSKIQGVTVERVTSSISQLNIPQSPIEVSFKEIRNLIRKPDYVIPGKPIEISRAKTTIVTVGGRPFSSGSKVYQQFIGAATTRPYIREYVPSQIALRPLQRRTKPEPYTESIMTRTSSTTPTEQVVSPVSVEVQAKNLEIFPTITRNIDSTYIPETSLFYGKGSYELTTGGLAPGQLGQRILITETKPTTKPPIYVDSDIQIDIDTVKPIVSDIDLISTGTILRTQPIFTDKYIEVNNNLFKEDNISKSEFTQNEMQLQRQQQLQLQLQLQLQAQKQQQALRQQQLLRTELVKPNRFGGKTRIPKIKIPKIRLYGLDKSKPESRVKQAFDVIVYKRGKEVTIARGLPEFAAKRAGAREVLTSLRASFKLRPKGTTTQEDISYKLPETFRLGKYDKLRFVQKKTTRFGTGTETKEAQFFRKASRSRIKWL